MNQFASIVHHCVSEKAFFLLSCCNKTLKKTNTPDKELYCYIALLYQFYVAIFYKIFTKVFLEKIFFIKNCCLRRNLRLPRGHYWSEQAIGSLNIYCILSFGYSSAHTWRRYDVGCRLGVHFGFFKSQRAWVLHQMAAPPFIRHFLQDSTSSVWDFSLSLTIHKAPDVNNWIFFMYQ